MTSMQLAPAPGALEFGNSEPLGSSLIHSALTDDGPGALERCYADLEELLGRAPELLIPAGPVSKVGTERWRLRERERVLGPATISADALGLVLRLARTVATSLEPTVVHHPPSFSAAAKQAALGGVLAHKTITARVGPRLVLCTGAGDYLVGRATLRRVGARLGLSQAERRRVSVNPGDVIPELDLGLLRGIVSPFISDDEAGAVAALVLLSHAPDACAKPVAIPLSPCESLIVAGEALVAIVKAFAARRLRGVKLITVPAGVA